VTQELHSSDAGRLHIRICSSIPVFLFHASQQIQFYDMNVVIIGAGLVGSSLGETLRTHGHDIAIVERDPPRCALVSDSMDVLAILGSGSNPRDLERAGIAQADMLIAATPDDEVNLISCGIARFHGVTHRIARVRSDMFAPGGPQPEDFGITQVIHPERSTLEAVLDIVETPGAIDMQDFQQRSVLLRSFLLKEGMPMIDRTLIDLRSDDAGRMLLVVAILRGGEVIIPRGATMLRAGDKPLCIFPRSSLRNVMSLVGVDSTARRRAIVFGDTLTAINIAVELEQQLGRVILIDPDARHADAAAARLRRSDVLLGDANDLDLLLEANIRYADFFIAATGQNDRNVFSCLLAKSEGAREVVAVVTDEAHRDLFHSIGIDHVINPRQRTAAGILNAVMPGLMAASLHIQKSDIDVLRLPVQENAPVAGTALKDSWKTAHGDAIVGAILRDGEMFVPRGDTVLHSGDTVLVFTRSAGLRSIRKIFGLDNLTAGTIHA
jgi:trk system potassium uptake protein